MASSIFSPYAAVTLSAVTYSTILGLAFGRNQNDVSLRALIKATSAGHATFATSLAIVSLCQSWTIVRLPDQGGVFSKDHNSFPLNDSGNPLIEGRNALANFVTAWEAGYLIYDTGAMLFESYVKKKSRGLGPAFIRLLRSSPIVIAHHVLLVGGLLLLQSYIVVGREKGLKIIMAFILMNASTPLLHLRWWRKKVTGRRDLRVDLALAFVFAATRFGSVYWVMKRYGQYHDLDSWQAFTKQRLPCQAGTGLLTALNALWWLGLLRQLVRQEGAQN